MVYRRYYRSKDVWGLAYLYFEMNVGPEASIVDDLNEAL